MDTLQIAAVGWSITVVGWLMGALVSKAVNAQAKRIDELQRDALLTSASGLRTDNSSLKEMAQKLQQLAYEAENLLDEMDYYRLEHEIQKKAFSSSCFRRTYHFIISLLNVSGHVKRFNLSRRMKKLDKQLQKSLEAVHNSVGIVDFMSRYTTTQTTERRTKLRQTTSFERETKFFGRIQEHNQLINLLKNKNPAIVGKVPIVAIVGTGGVGKTALARLVFTNPEIDSYFEVRIWICVSTQFNSVELTREMLEGVCGNRYDELKNLNELQKILWTKLKLKRFILVLDDMWEDEDKSQWDLMVDPLNDGRVSGSIILVTTRNQSVAKLVGARDILHLKGLQKDELLSFLSTCIFHDENYGGNGKLRTIGEKIVDKLKGNPLAAKTVAAMLVDKRCDDRSWIKIMDNEEWIYQTGPDHIMPALEVSYKHMPIHLQRCFSYCAMLPEDHTFTCEELVYLWMAQGLLNVRPEVKTMEDIGSDYFNDLLNRGFFQSEDGGLLCYTFHENLLHRFARMVSIEECLRINDTEQIRQILPTIRHLSIFNCTKRSEEIGNALAALKRKNLSTIVNWDRLPPGTFQCIYDMVKETQFLRAMRITLCSQVQPINLNFQKFVSLRYLRLIMPDPNTSNTLPKEICRLYHLEVFEIEGKLQELPNNFSNLVSLRHFIVEGELHSKICGVGKLTSLQGLNYFDVQQKSGFEIEQLGSLEEIGGYLHIRNLENVKSKVEASKARLAQKENLDVLHLHWNHGKQGNESVLEGLKPNTNLKSLYINGYGGVASPQWLLDPSLIFLESLTLKGCKAWQQLPPIGGLEFLKYLELSGMAVREIGPWCYGTHQRKTFPSLEVFEIRNMPDLENVLWSDQLQLSLCFKRLKKLTVVDCSKLVEFPLSGCDTSVVLERFPCLESLEIRDCPLIFQLPLLPYSSLLSSISIATTGFIKYMDYRVNSDSGITRKCCLNLDQRSSLKVDEILSLHVLSSLRVLEISCISSLESFDLHSFEALETLVIKECQSLTSLTFGEHLVCLRSLSIISCETLTTINGLRSWINLEWLHFQECPGFIAAWDSASKEIESTKPDFSLSLTIIEGDSLALLTLPICKQLKSLQAFLLEVSCFAEDNVVSLQLLNSIDLVDIEGRKNLQSFPFDLFPSLKHLTIKFPHIDSLPTSSDTEISEEFSNLSQIKGIYIGESPVMIYFKLSEEEMICQQMDPSSVYHFINSNQRNDMDGSQLPLFWNQSYRRIYQLKPEK